MLDGNDDTSVERGSPEKSRSRQDIIQDLKSCREKISVLLANLKMVNCKLEEVPNYFYNYKKLWLIISFLVITRESEGDRLIGRKYGKTET